MACLIDLNEYVATFPGAKPTQKIGVTEINENLLNSMPNSWIKQAYVQVFDCEFITFKRAANMFEHMDITEFVYKGEVEPFNKKTSRTYANRDGHIRLKRGESALSNTYSEMSESASKCRRIYLDYLKGKSKPTCLIHGPGH